VAKCTPLFAASGAGVQSCPRVHHSASGAAAASVIVDTLKEAAPLFPRARAPVAGRRSALPQNHGSLSLILTQIRN